MRRRVAAAVVALIAAGCGPGRTDVLSSQLEDRFAREKVARRAPNIQFRYTRDPGGRDERREDRRASIVVTRSTVYIHKNDKVGLDLNPRTRRETAVERSGDRIRVRIGTGRSEEIWSFVPPDDATGWAADIRSVISQSSK